MGLSLYIHVPFCTRRCSYCSFYHVQSQEHELAFIERIERELSVGLGSLRERTPLQTVFIGGGTPSVLGPDSLTRLFAALAPWISPVDTVETTMELNPEDVSDELLERIVGYGVNRISLGIQSMHPLAQKVLSRCTPETNREAIRQVMERFDNVSFDVLLGVPGRQPDDLRATITELAGFSPTHLSVYGLEPGGDMSREVERFFTAVDPDQSVDEYLIVCEHLSGEGYRHYEVSNWARPGRESLHNRVYWGGGDYLGVGPAAHSYIDGRRFYNEPSLGAWLGSGEGGVRVEDAGADTPLERMMLGLRTADGVPQGWCDGRIVDELAAAGLAVREAGRVRLTDRGFLVLNDIVFRLVPDGEASDEAQ